MAKQSDQLARAVESEKSGSPLSGLLAEENEFDRRALWRIGSWGAAAVGAVVLAVVSNQWSLGLRRDQLAAADLTRQAQQIQSLAKESQNETRRLASAIETLNGDRDRLFARVTVIEQGLDSVTGALAKQAAPAPGPSPVSSAAPQASSTPQQNATAAQPPVPAPVATTAAVSPATDKPRADAGRPDAAPNPASMASAAPATTATTPPAPASGAAAASLANKSMMGPQDPAAPKLIEAAKSADTAPADTKGPDMKVAEAQVDAKLDAKADKGAEAAPAAASEVVASVDAGEDPQAEVASVAAKRTDFAVDLGSANSIGGLRALWRGVRHLNADLGALSPIIVIREGSSGLGMQLHLAAGPLKDAAAAARICAVLAETRRGCETTVYDGQRLAMKADATQPLPSIKATSDAKIDAKAEGKPDAKSGASRHGSYRHAKKEEPPPPPPKPESTSTFSSLFGRK